MPKYRILYLKSSEIERFQRAAPKNDTYQLWDRQYEEVGHIEAPSAYAAWKELSAEDAGGRGIRPMSVGDVLEPEGEKPLLCHFWGFDEASWREHENPFAGPPSGDKASDKDSEREKQADRAEVYS